MKIKGHINAGTKEEHVTYACIKCGKENTIVFRPKQTDRTFDLCIDAIEERLCLSCLTGTDARVSGTAENLEALFCH